MEWFWIFLGCFAIVVVILVMADGIAKRNGGNV